MKLPRTSILSLMLVVGMVALDLALGRVIFLAQPWRRPRVSAGSV